MDYMTQSPEEIKKQRLFEAQSYLTLLAETNSKEWTDNRIKLIEKQKEIPGWAEITEGLESYVDINYFAAIENILQNSKMLEQKGIVPDGFVQKLLNKPLPKSGETLLTGSLKNLIRNHGSDMLSETMRHIGFLIEQGVDVNAPNEKGQYPLELIFAGQKKGMKDSDFGILKSEGHRAFFAGEPFDGYQTVEDYIISHTAEETHAAMRNKTATNLSVMRNMVKNWRL